MHDKLHELGHFMKGAHEIRSNINLLQKQAARIKKVMSWNGYPCYI